MWTVRTRNMRDHTEDEKGKMQVWQIPEAMKTSAIQITSDHHRFCIFSTQCLVNWFLNVSMHSHVAHNNTKYGLFLHFDCRSSQLPQFWILNLCFINHVSMFKQWLFYLFLSECLTMPKVKFLSITTDPKWYPARQSLRLDPSASAFYNVSCIYWAQLIDSCCNKGMWCCVWSDCCGLSCFSEAKSLRDEEILQTLPVGTTASFYFSDLGPQLTWGTVSPHVHRHTILGSYSGAACFRQRTTCHECFGWLQAFFPKWFQ